MSNPMFSIIVPTHNAENYIRRGLDSIATQTFRDYELIIICDCCTDKTELLARQYGAIVDTVRFRRDGLSRDRGIERATGEWILFMDDDDWFMHEFCFRQLSQVVGKQDEDMLAFGYIWKHMGYYPPTEEDLFTPRVAHVWSRCWRRSSIGNARFGDALFSSDTYFLKSVKPNIKKTALFNMPIYYYNFMRPGSQTDLFTRCQLKQSPVAE